MLDTIVLQPAAMMVEKTLLTHKKEIRQIIKDYSSSITTPDDVKNLKKKALSIISNLRKVRSSSWHLTEADRMVIAENIALLRTFNQSLVATSLFNSERYPSPSTNNRMQNFNR